MRRIVAGWLMTQALGLGAAGLDLKAFYQARCAACHGVDGTGRGPGGIRLGGRNWTDPKWVARQEVSDLVAAVLKGQGAMPGFRRHLTEAEARTLVQTLIKGVGSRRSPAPAAEPPAR